MPIAYVRFAAKTRYGEYMLNLARHPAVWLVAAGILCGCGSGQPAGGASRPATPAAVAKKPAKPADTLSRTMVTAVAASKPSAVPVQVRFELKGRPEVGQPVEIELAILPMSGAVDRVSGNVMAEEGLELLEGAQIPAAERPEEGVPISHTIKVLPKRDGIFIFNAVLTVDSAGQTSSETFSMPLVAGAGFQSPPAKPAATTAAAQ
jgi:hypothetical protein